MIKLDGTIGRKWSIPWVNPESFIGSSIRMLLQINSIFVLHYRPNEMLGYLVNSSEIFVIFRLKFLEKLRNALNRLDSTDANH